MVPPEVPINTGGLCSAGSGCHAVPDFDLLCRPPTPAPFSHRSGSPCSWPTSCGALFSAPRGRRHVRPHVPCVGDGSPALRHAGMGRGEARASQVTGPSSSYVPWSNTPPETPPSLPRRYVCGGCYGLQVQQDPRPPGRLEVSGPHAPWPTRSHADASRPHFWIVARLATGSGGLTLPGGFAPLDDKRSFMSLSPLHSPSTAFACRTDFPILERLLLRGAAARLRLRIPVARDYESWLS